MPNPSPPGAQASDADGTLFAAAQGAPFRTPLWHWAMTWRESRYVPEWARGGVTAATHALLWLRIELPQGFSFARRWTWRDCNDKELRQQRALWRGLAWPGSAPTPSECLDLAWAFDGPYAVRVHAVRDSDFEFCLLITDEGSPLVYALREVDLARAHVEHAFIALPPERKGSGVGAQVLANALAFYRRFGLLSVGLTAGLTEGGAVWAKFGFKPVNENEWERVKPVVRRNLRSLPRSASEAYQDFVGASLSGAVEAVLRRSKPESIWALHDLDPGGRVAEGAGLSHGLGGALLHGSRWRGILDLTDGRAERRARGYIQRKIDRGEVTPPPNWT